MNRKLVMVGGVMFLAIIIGENIVELIPSPFEYGSPPELAEEIKKLDGWKYVVTVSGAHSSTVSASFESPDKFREI